MTAKMICLIVVPGGEGVLVKPWQIKGLDGTAGRVRRWIRQKRADRGCPTIVQWCVQKQR